MQAGAAIRDISPRKPAFLVGYPHVDRISEGIHDPLLASALCLRNGETAVMLVALDILFIDPPTARDLRRRVAERADIPQEHVFISCSHTHSGPNTCYVLEWGPSPVVPDVDAEYMAFLADSVTAAAGEAAANLRDAEVAWGTARAQGVGGNRHDPEQGASDPEVGLLAVRDVATQRLFALSLIYSMHPTVMHEDSRLVSTDFPYYTREFLKARFGEELIVLYHNGPEGNQSPRYHVKAQTFSRKRSAWASCWGRRWPKAWAPCGTTTSPPIPCWTAGWRRWSCRGGSSLPWKRRSGAWPNTGRGTKR